MVKVLKEQKPDEWSATIECIGCASTLEVHKEDVKYTGWLYNGNGDYYSVDCPICGFNNLLEGVLVSGVLTGYVMQYAKSHQQP